MSIKLVDVRSVEKLMISLLCWREDPKLRYKMCHFLHKLSDLLFPNCWQNLFNTLYAPSKPLAQENKDPVATVNLYDITTL